MIHVFVSMMSGRSETIPLAKDATLLDLKFAVEDKFQITPEVQMLVFNGKPLPADAASEGRCLSSFRIENYCSVCLIKQKVVEMGEEETKILNLAKLEGSGEEIIDRLQVLHKERWQKKELSTLGWFPGPDCDSVGCLAGWAIGNAVRCKHWKTASRILDEFGTAAVSNALKWNLRGPYHGIVCAVPSELLKRSLDLGMPVTEAMLYESAYKREVLSILLCSMQRLPRLRLITALNSQPEFVKWGETHDGESFQQYCQKCIPSWGWTRERILWMGLFDSTRKSKLSLLSASVIQSLVNLACPTCNELSACGGFAAGGDGGSSSKESIGNAGGGSRENCCCSDRISIGKSNNNNNNNNNNHYQNNNCNHSNNCNHDDHHCNGSKACSNSCDKMSTDTSSSSVETTTRRTSISTPCSSSSLPSSSSSVFASSFSFFPYAAASTNNQNNITTTSTTSTTSSSGHAEAVPTSFFTPGSIQFGIDMDREKILKVHQVRQMLEKILPKTVVAGQSPMLTPPGSRESVGSP